MEADVLRWALLVIGSLVIVGLAVHGIWISRKNSENQTNANKSKNEQQYQPSDWQSDTDQFDAQANNSNVDFDENLDESLDSKLDIGMHATEQQPEPTFDIPAATESNYDDLGLGAVRVVSGDPQVNTQTNFEAQQSLATQIEAEPEVPPRKIYASVVTQPKPEYVAQYTSLAADTVAISQQERAKSNNRNESKDAVIQAISVDSNDTLPSNDSYQAPEPPPCLLKKDIAEQQSTIDSTVVADTSANSANISESTEQKTSVEKSHINLAEKLSLSEQARNLVKRKKANSAKERRDPKISEEQMHIDFDEQPSPKPASTKVLKAKSAAQQIQEQEVLVLNVKSTDANPIPGSALLPMLLTLGFKFGDQDIFHRHVNASGKGPVLFSLANMFKPGNFDIDNLENFSTQGISLFMILPIEGDPHQVFNMMHNAARKIADEFSAQIYDGKRTLLTKQSLQQYVEKIREFERQRLIRG